MNKAMLIAILIIVLLGVATAAYIFLASRGQVPSIGPTPQPLAQTPLPTVYPFASATPFPLVTLPTNTPTPIATATPQLVITTTATPSPTASPSATALPTLPPDVPVTGVGLPTIFVIAAGAILLVLGLVVAL